MKHNTWWLIRSYHVFQIDFIFISNLPKNHIYTQNGNDNEISFKDEINRPIKEEYHPINKGNDYESDYDTFSELDEDTDE